MRRWLSYFMKSIWILLLICGVVGSVLSFAQSGDRSDLPPGFVYPPGVWQFYLRGVGYSASIDKQSVLAAPTWLPSQPLPLDFARVEEIARRELHRFVDNDAAWEPTDFSLHRLKLANPPRWFYVVEFMPTSFSYTNRHADNFKVCIDASGKPGTCSAIISQK